jgi:hypothetical protein
MPVELSGQLHSAVVSEAAADVIFLARAAARVRPADGAVAAMLTTLLGFDDTRAHSAVILRAIDRPTVAATASRRAASRAAEGRPDQELAQLVDAAERHRMVTGSPWVTTAHLLIAGLDAARADNRSPTVPADAVLRAAACTAPTDPEDDAFRGPSGGPPSWLDGLPVPPPPQQEELRRRTTGREFAVAARLFSSFLPEGGRINTSLGLRTTRRWALVLTAQMLLMVTLLYVVIRGALTDSLWQLLLVLPVVLRLSEVPAWLWAAATLTGMFLGPWPVPLLLLAYGAATAAVVRSELLMRRVDLGDPSYSLRNMRAAVRGRAQEIALRSTPDRADESQ